MNRWSRVLRLIFVALALVVTLLGVMSLTGCEYTDAGDDCYPMCPSPRPPRWDGD